ncbi:MAG: hypothetical protein AAB606_05530 [Patescibacteria group bacterium]
MSERDSSGEDDISEVNDVLLRVFGTTADRPLQKYVPVGKEVQVVTDTGTLTLRTGDSFVVIPPSPDSDRAVIFIQYRIGETIKGITKCPASTVLKFPNERRIGKSQPGTERVRDLLRSADKILLEKGLNRWDNGYLGNNSDHVFSPSDVLGMIGRSGNLVKVRRQETGESFSLLLHHALIAANESMTREAISDGHPDIVKPGIDPSFTRIGLAMARQSDVILAELQKKRRS